LPHFGLGTGPNWFGFACLREFIEPKIVENIWQNSAAAYLGYFQLSDGLKVWQAFY